MKAEFETSPAAPAPLVIPNEYAWLSIKISWKLLGQQYGLLISAVIIMNIASLAIRQIDFVGPVLSTILVCFLSPGYFMILKDICQKQPGQIKTMFFAFHNDQLTARIIPFVIASTIVALIIEILTWTFAKPYASTALGAGGGLILALLTIIWTTANLFSVPLIVFKDQKYVDTITLNIDAVMKNALTFFLFVICIALLMFAALICFIFPIFFAAMPMMAIAQYLMYSAVFEGHELTESSAEQTVPVDPQELDEKPL